MSQNNSVDQAAIELAYQQAISQAFTVLIDNLTQNDVEVIAKRQFLAAINVTKQARAIALDALGVRLPATKKSKDAFP
jgi:hypothetical protein